MARKSNKHPRSVTTPQEKPQVRRVAFGTAMFRIVILAVLATGFAVYGLVRHFTHPYKTMLEPTPDSDPDSDPTVEVQIEGEQ